MSDKSKIAWTDETLNVVIGCEKVSAGCANCYAIPTTHRGMAEQHRGVTKKIRSGVDWNGEINLVPSRLFIPCRQQRARRIFVNSLSDLWHKNVDPDFVAALYGVALSTPRHTYQILTKRPERMREWYRHMGSFRDDTHFEGWPGAVVEAFSQALAIDSQLYREGKGQEEFHSKWCGGAQKTFTWPPPNVHLGITVEDQAAAEERIPILLDTPATVRWLSVEPMLEQIDLRPWLGSRELHWVVVGGESGNGARPCKAEWIQDVVDQCRDVGVPVFVKQLGADVRCSGATWGVEQERNHGGLTHWPEGTKRTAGLGDIHIDLNQSKGGEIDEWPESLRVREFPA